ncbi:putative Zn(II)2Cys6 transcription factor [Aspergillus carlsbadensis]|nr:putative Zn(II)2Cys6 transcription factor [Aspergillus carlsbadensis]
MPDNRSHESSSPPLGGECDQLRSARASGRKRKRVSVACRSCRARKSRCNGARPCSSCEDVGTECQYEQLPSQHVPASGPRTSDLLDANALLERRLRTIEEQLQALRSERRSSEVQPVTSATAPEGQHPQAPMDVEGTPIQDHGVDGMGAVPLKDGADEDEYFGSSSNVAFLRMVMNSVGHQPDLVFRNPGYTMSHSIGIGQSSGSNSDALFARPPIATPLFEGRGKVREDPLKLPSAEEIEHLLRLYFTTVNLMIPCIHEGSFRETYSKLQSHGLSSVSRTWLGILNVILAITTNVMSPTSPTCERAAKSNIYFDQALQLIRPSVFGRISLEIVQLSLLMETYLEGTPSSSMTWTFHGLAVKGAYQLGLHVVDGSRNLPELDQEIRKRLWYWCVMNDRFLSVRYGRPPLIQLSHVRLDESLRLPFSNVSSATTASSLEFFDAILSITHIMGDALERLYGQNLQFHTNLSMSETLDRISGLSWKLAHWQDSLPSTLQIINTTKEALSDVPLTVGTTRFRVLLSLRYLGAKILIIRPILRKFLDMGSMTPSHEHRSEWLLNSGSGLLAELVRTCRNVLQISKSILHGSKSDQNLLGAWWFSCFYTFNASLAILAVLLIKRIPAYSRAFSMLSILELRNLVNTAIDILHGLDQGNETLIKCQDTLRKFLLAIEIDATDALPVQRLDVGTHRPGIFQFRGFDELRRRGIWHRRWWWWV